MGAALGPVGMGLDVAGLGAGILGGFLKGNAEQAALQAKANADRQNQQLAEGQAADALQRGAREAGQLRMKGSQVIGQERAGYGGSGVDTNVGSAAEVQAGTRAMSELDAQTATNNAARAAWGHHVSANQYGDQAALDEQAKGEVGTSTFLGGLGQAVSGGAGVANKYNKLF